jgi:uncharacterized protein YbjQ (UPF0145 family)
MTPAGRHCMAIFKLYIRNVKAIKNFAREWRFTAGIVNIRYISSEVTTNAAEVIVYGTAVSFK